MSRRPPRSTLFPNRTLFRSIGAPILVHDRLWGVLGVTTRRGRFSDDAGQRLEEFGELVAAALANAQARDELRRLVDEQAALRRVAELVARGVDRQEVFTAVASEAASLMEDRPTQLLRF